MEQAASNLRNIYGNQFGDNAWVNQGDTHIHLPSTSAQSKIIRVIPYPKNEDLVQRPDLLGRLEKLLPPTSKHNSAALWGLGGSGKTQIALEYAYRRSEEEDCSVYWVHADSEATFIQDYQTIAKRFGINTNIKTEELLDMVRQCIDGQSKWVLVLDNADDLSLFGVGQDRTTSLSKFIPKGTVLWTSRDERIAGSLVSPRRGIEVAKMKVEEAEELLLVSRNEEGDGKDTDSATLLKELEWFPLAIAQAGAYMRRTSTPVKEYLALLAESEDRWKVLSIAESDRHRRPDVPNSILKTWSISIKRIKQENELAYRLFHVIPYLDYRRVRFEMLLAASEWKGREKLPTKPDKLVVLQAVTRLKEFSFISPLKLRDNIRAYEMHKLVQDAARYALRIRKNLTSEDGEYTCESHLAADSEKSFSSIAINVVFDFLQNPIDTKPTDALWRQKGKYQTHAIRAAKWAGLCGMEAEAAYLLEVVAALFVILGRMKASIPIRLRSIELLEKVFEKGHREVIESKRHLAACYEQQNSFGKAEDLYKEVMALCPNESGDTDRLRFKTKVNLASLYDKQSRFAESKRLKFKLLNDSKKKFGENSAEAAMNMMRLAETYQFQELFTEADNLIRRAIRLCSVPIPNDPDLLCFGGDTLVKQYVVQGRYAEAEHLQVWFLHFFFNLYGLESFWILNSVWGLTDICILQKRFKEAQFLWFVIWSISCELLGKQSPLSQKALDVVCYMASGHICESGLAKLLGKWKPSSLP